MLLESPHHVKYPWTVTEILKQKADEVERGTALLSYSVKQLAPEYNADGEESMVEKTLLLRFESPTDGNVVRWRVHKDDVLDQPGYVLHDKFTSQSSTLLTFHRVPLVEIDEPCTHEVQFGGMCANCGKDMTESVRVAPEY